MGKWRTSLILGLAVFTSSMAIVGAETQTEVEVDVETEEKVEVEVEREKKVFPNDSDEETFDIHIVERGETLWIISDKYKVDFTTLVELNTQFENPDLIYPMDEVAIPNGKIKAFSTTSH